jgi:PAS domain S-box-containing protein
MITVDKKLTDHRQELVTQTGQTNTQLLSLIMNNIPQAVFWKDRDLVYLGCNQAFAEDAGLASPEEIIGKTDFDMPWKEQAELYRADDGLVMESGEPKINYEEPHTTSDGSRTRVRTSKIPVRENGEIVAVLGMYEDITERKSAEKALTDSEAQFRLLFEQSADAILLIENGIFIDCNEATVRMMRAANKEEFLSLHPSKLSPEYQPDGRHSGEKADDMMRIALQKGSNRFEWIHRRVDGTDFPVEVLLTPISKGDRQFIHTVWRDITERRKLEQQIQMAFERRGLQAQLSTQVSQAIASAATLEELYQRVVTQVKEKFNYYHTQLLRYDPAQEAVVLVTGYGEAGARMLAAGHHLSMGEGLIGTAAVAGETVLRPALENDLDWRPNPLLPDTKGEIAVPIKLGNTILGVLDVQSRESDALGKDDQLLLEGLCGQIATAIESTRLRQEMVERLEEINRLYRAMSHEGWQSYRETSGIPTNFMFDQAGLRPVDDSNLLDEQFAKIPLVVPGGEVIGALAIADDPQRPVSREDQAFLEQVAEQVALALESARLFEQTQEALIQTEELSRQNELILDTAGEGIFGLDEKGNHTFVNPAAAAMLKYSPKELIGSHSHSIWHHSHSDGSHYPTEECPIYASLQEGKIHQGEEYFWRKDGSGFFVDFTSTPVKQGERTIGAVVTFRDITERKKAEEELLRVRLGMDRANDAVFMTDTNGTIIYVNPAFERIYGWPKEEAIGQTPRIFKSGLIPLEQYKEFWKTLLNKQTVAGEILNKRKDGRLIPIEASNSPIIDAHGQVIGFMGLHKDITERKQAQEIIAKRAQQMETVAKLSTTASTVLDPDKLLQAVVDLTKERFGLYHVHIYLADEAWQMLLLAAGAGEVGRKMVADGWNIPVDHQSSIVASAARNRKSVIANDVYRDKDSLFLSNRLLPDTRSEMAVPMIVAEKVLGVFDVQSDVAGHFTEEDINIYTTLATQVGIALQNARLYVEQAATVAQLRELDKLKSSFLANMSHELRTPLNSILGFTDVIMEGLDGPLTEYMDSDLRLIQKNGQHLLHLINDVLDMAKIEAGRMNLQPETFNIHALLEEVNSITSTLASEKNLSLSIDTNSDQAIEVYADNTRLRQVMINLVNNAIKFTEKGKIILVAQSLEGGRVLITVKDTGIGIPSEKLEAIFQEFTQVDSSTTRKTGGTGLGLPISRRLVEMHGGRLWAESTGIPGEGSTFFVELPLEARITEVIEKQVK